MHLKMTGTVLMMGRGKDAGRGKQNETTTGHNIWLYRAPAWNASYEWVRSNGKDGSVMTYPGVSTQAIIRWVNQASEWLGSIKRRNVVLKDCL